MNSRILTCGTIALMHVARVAGGQSTEAPVVARSDSVMIRLIDVDVRAAVQALARHLDRPVTFGNVPAARVTVETPAPIATSAVAGLLRGVLASHALLLVEEGAIYRIEPRPQPAAATVAPISPDSGSPELHVIRLRHARAAEVAATVNALYGRASSFGELGRGRSGRTLDDALRENRVPPGADASAAAVQGTTARAAVLAGEVTIVPDTRANTLLVRASPRDFALIDDAVRQIDVRPLQVLIEVLIAEVRKDRSLDFGVDARLPTRNLPGTSTQVGGNVTGGGLGDLVVRLMSMGGSDIDATLRAASARGDVSIVSRPVVIAANNEPAEILVGSQRPFVQISRSLPTDAAVRDQVVQYRDVGTRLSVLPTISADGYVMLEVTQEVNAATSETAFNAPVISTRTVQTRLLVKTGQTVAMGGLSDRQKDSSQGGVPILSSIPIIGGLFGRASRHTSETELLLFLTPRILTSDADADGATQPLLKRAERIKP